MSKEKDQLTISILDPGQIRLLGEIDFISQKRLPGNEAS